MKKRWTKFSKFTYGISLISIILILILSSMGERGIIGIGFVFLFHSIILFINVVQIILKLVVGLIKEKQLGVRLLDVFLSLVFAFVFITLYSMIFFGTIVFLLPILA